MNDAMPAITLILIALIFIIFPFTLAT